MLDPKDCGNDLVCISIEETKAIAEYIVLTEERNLDLERCPYIKERP